MADTALKVSINRDVESIGDEIRQLRKARGLTLQELADVTGKSVGFLSQVERNLTKPSVAALQDISEALEVHIGWFFQGDVEADETERQYIVRKNARRRLSYSDLSSTDYLGHYDHLLSANLNGELVLGMSRYEPGCSSGDDCYSHKGEEAGFVLQGRLELSIGDQVYILNEGDSFSFPSTVPHRFANPAEDKDTVVIWANTPITLRQ